MGTRSQGSLRATANENGEPASADRIRLLAHFQTPCEDVARRLPRNLTGHLVAHSLPRILLILPCFNEAATVGGVLEEINGLGKHYDSLVVDDGSTDGTFEAASEATHRVRLLRNLGIGGAVQTGIKYAHRNGYDLCIQIDGDGQHPPDQIAALVDAYLGEPVNVLVGSRFVVGDSFRSTWARRLGSRIITGFIGLLFGPCALTDPTSGMRLMDRTAMAFFSATYPHDFPEPISLAWALRHDLTIGEVPVKMRPRQIGCSSIMGLTTLSYMARVLFYIIIAAVQRRPPT